ncbi:MAG: hypothetical protein Q7J14_02325 [Candidatus Magasanikbacteria bacterium]|nr:hypothetical protein [Candidatus Magasanikbacteria bacterium]
MENRKGINFDGENKRVAKETDFFTPKEIAEIKENSMKVLSDIKDQKAKGLFKALKPKKRFGGSLYEGLQDFDDEKSVFTRNDNSDTDEEE